MIFIHPNRIFVGGLPRSTKETELEKYFSKYGTVVDVHVILDKLTPGLNKGYGFVTYASREVREKVLKMEMVGFCGRRLRLREAIRRKEDFVNEPDEVVPSAKNCQEVQVQWGLVPAANPWLMQTPVTQNWQNQRNFRPYVPWKYYSYHYVSWPYSYYYGTLYFI